MKIILPFTVTIPRKKKEDKVFALNLNVYRNAHHMTLNQSKVLWKDEVKRALDKCSFAWDAPEFLHPPFRFTYTAFPASNRKFDLGNVLSIVDKFTADALQEFGIVPDDSYKIIPELVFRFGCVDKLNPRIELDITSIG